MAGPRTVRAVSLDSDDLRVLADDDWREVVDIIDELQAVLEREHLEDLAEWDRRRYSCRYDGGDE